MSYPTFRYHYLNPTQTGRLTDGQLFIGESGEPARGSHLTPGPGISIENGPGTITISSVEGYNDSISSSTQTSVTTEIPVLSLQIPTSGHYLASFNCNTSNTGASESEVELKIKLNGTEVQGSTRVETIQKTTKTTLGLTQRIYVQQNQILSITMKATTPINLTNRTLLIYKMG